MTTSTTGARLGFTISLLALVGACEGPPSQGGHAGMTGMGSAGETGAAGASPGTGGASAGAGGGAAGATSPGTAGNGVAGNGGAAGAGGGAAGATSPGAAGNGVAGNSGAAGAADGGAAGTTTDGGAGSPSDGGPRPDAGSSSKVLIYGVTTGFRHGSITAAAKAITAAAATHGLTTDIVGCTNPTNMPDPTKFTAQALAGYGAVILLANSGEPFGYPATTEIQNLVDYVKNGGALIAIEDADHCYTGFNGHPATPAYINLIGNTFTGHPGGVAPATCTKKGTHSSVMQLPATFGTTDEIYATSDFRMDNQVVLTCVSSGASTPTVRPISYVREEGAGRVFFTALGHPDVVWTAPMDSKAANTRLVEDHVIPALLWAMRR